MKTVKKELKEKKNYKPELTIYERVELGKQLIDASQNGDLERVKELIKKGADLNVQNGFGNTALICSSANNNHEIINLLVQNGANVNVRCNDGITALEYSILNGHKEISEILVKKGAKIRFALIFCDICECYRLYKLK
jgi:uncharacterized protein